VSDCPVRLVRPDGATAAYRVCSPLAPGGAPLLLIHGLASNGSRFAEFAERTTLAERHALIRVDLRGHGDAVTRRRIGIDLWCDDLAAVLDVEGGAAAIVVCLVVAARRLRRGAGIVTAIARTTGLDRLRFVQARMEVLGEAEEAARRLVDQPGRLARAFGMGVAVNLLVLVEYRLLLGAFGLPHDPLSVCAAIFATGAAHSLRPDEIARIDVDLYRDVLHGRSFHVPYAGGGGEKVQRVLRQVGNDEHCIFLAPDGRCLVHARQGAAAKPDTCQLFPLATIVTAHGPRLTLRIACASLHESYETGTPLAEYVPSCFELERKERSVILGLWRGARRAPAEAAGSSGARWSLFVTFAKGMEELVRAIAARLPADGIRLGARVARLERRDGGWRIERREREPWL